MLSQYQKVEHATKQTSTTPSDVAPEIDAEITPSPRAGHSLCILNSKCYLFGGASHEQGFLNDLYSYDLDTKLWGSLEPKIFPHERYEHSTAVVDDKILIMFGACDQGPTNDIWEYNTGNVITYGKTDILIYYRSNFAFKLV
jgi:hypothetical protein